MKKSKKSISVSEMNSKKLYVEPAGKMYRRLEKELEVFSAGKWENVMIDYRVLNDLRLKER